ncbi:MAG: GAF domain-containing protein [Anaerolineae bacterium]|nr:GAF domain-containing protein [Anaerolineae bacterium]
MSAPNPTTQEKSTARDRATVDVATRTRNVFLFALVILIGTTLAVPVYLYLAFQTGTWQLFVIAGLSFTLNVASIIGVILTRRDRPTLAAWALFGALLVVFPIMPLLIADIGLTSAASIVLLIVALALQMMPLRSAGQAIIASALVGLGIILLDRFGPAQRLSVPQLNVVLLALGIAALILFQYLAIRQFRDYPMSMKLIISLAMTAAIAVVGVSLIAIQTMRTSLTEQIGQDYAVQAESVGRLIDAFFKEKVSQIVTLETVDVVRKHVEERNASYTGDPTSILAEIQALDERWVKAGDDDPLILAITSPDPAVNPATSQLMAHLEAFPAHTEIFITDRYGATVGATGRLSDYYQADEAWWQAAWNDGEGAVYISEPEYDESAGITALLIAVPIFDEERGAVIGIARSTLNVESLYAQVGAVRYGETGHAALFDSAAEVLYEPVEEGEEASQALDLDLRQELISTRDYLLATDADGDQSIFVGAPVSAASTGESETEAAVAAAVANLGWTIAIRQESEEAFAPVAQITQDVQLVGAAIIIVGGSMALVPAQFVARPLLALTEATEAMGAGNLDAPLPQASRDEVGSLTASFGEMAGRLKQTLSGLEQRARIIETSANVSRRLSTILDQEQLVAEVVQQVQSAFDYYHAHIYLIDEASRDLVMTGGTGTAGQTMLADGHRIPWGRGLTGRAAATADVVLVPDVSQEEGWLPNPLLPETKSEVAVPITLGERVLGVLDVQHNVVGGLDEADVGLLQSVAGQVAIALQNARVFAEVRERAEQEALVNRIAQQIQRTTTIETTLQAAARELGRALGAQRASVQLEPTADGDRPSQ